MQTAISRIAEAGAIEKKMKADALSLVFSGQGGPGEEDEAVAPCNHAADGCEWEGTASERADHLCWRLQQCCLNLHGLREVHAMVANREELTKSLVKAAVGEGELKSVW